MSEGVVFQAKSTLDWLTASDNLRTPSTPMPPQAAAVHASDTGPPRSLANDAVDAASRFSVGDAVEARYQACRYGAMSTSWFHGTVRAVHAATPQEKKGTYDIDYDDGDNEACVPARFVRAVRSAPRPPDTSDAATSLPPLYTTTIETSSANATETVADALGPVSYTHLTLPTTPYV